MINPGLLWKGVEGAPLMVIYPGGTGSRRPIMRGFDAMAGHFWMRGFSCYIGEVGGQDGHPGAFSVQRAVDESRLTLASLRDSLRPSATCLFGSCSGGTIATWLAGENSLVDLLILYETLPAYPTTSAIEFGERAKASGVKLADAYMEEYLDTEQASPKVICPVLLLCGDASAPPVVTEEDIQRLATGFTKARFVETWTIAGANHNATRGSDLPKLWDILARIDAAIDKHIGAHLPSTAVGINKQNKILS